MVQLRDDVRVVRAEAVGAAGHLAGQLDDARIDAPIGGDQRFQRRAIELGARHLTGDVEPGARLDLSHLLVDAVERALSRQTRARPAQRARHAVAQLLGEATEARELRTGDREKTPALLLHDPVRPRDLRRGLAGLVRQRAHPRVRVAHLLAAHARIRQRLSRLGEQVVHLVTRGVHAIEIAVEVRVGGADQRELPPRNDEDHAIVAGRLVDRPLGHPRQQAMDALGAAQQALPSLGHAGHGAHGIHPGARGIDQHARTEARRRARQQISGDDTDDRAAGVARDLFDLAVVERARAVAAGGQHVLEAQALGRQQQIVEVIARAAQIVGPQPGLEAERVDRRQHAVALAVAARREPVVQRQPDAYLDDTARGIPIDRHEERQRPHEMRGEAAQPLALR